MTQQRGRGLASQPIPPHKITDSTTQQRVDRMIANADNFGYPKPRQPASTLNPPPMAAADMTSVSPRPKPKPYVKPSKSNAGPRTAADFDADRREAAAHADSVLKGKRKY